MRYHSRGTGARMRYEFTEQTRKNSSGLDPHEEVLIVMIVSLVLRPETSSCLVYHRTHFDIT
jgi:hypothetical protein